jgi:ABC-type protease/lipase transport system fused ATPase/permease subunit
MGRCGLDLDPAGLVGDLCSSDRLLFGVALALVGAPDAVVVDDVHEHLTTGERALVMARLRSLADGGIAVVCGSLDPAATAGADTVVVLAGPGAGSPSTSIGTADEAGAA